MKTGRTKPAIFKCEDEQGNEVGEFVVKMRAGTEAGVTGLTCELVSSLLAEELGITTPVPAIVEINPAIGKLLGSQDSEVAQIIRKSPGLNFGSQVLTGGYGVIPIEKSIPASIRPLAADIFAFDACIQNPDRKVNNQNLLWKADEIFVIDHELAFSFLFLIGAPTVAWKLEGAPGDFLKEHVFYRELKGQAIDLDRFEGALNAISDGHLATMFDQIPKEWENDHVSRISGHLKSVRDHSAEFVNQVKWRLV
ncbi:MAG TPA: HipA family kinase [Candidatus Binatia bacterium]|jgi:hypothetical protein